MGLRGELGLLGDGDLGAAGVDGLGEGLDEALGVAGDEREVDVDPVGAGCVVDDGPALEGGGWRGGRRDCVGEENAVGGLPDGDFREVGEAELAGAGAGVIEGDAADGLVAVGVEQLEVLGEVVVGGGVEEADGESGGHLEDADFAGVGGYGDEAGFGAAGAVLVRFVEGGLMRFDVEETAGEGGAGAVDLDTGAPQGGEEAGVGGLCGQAEGEGCELLVERRGGVVVGARDAAAVKVDGGEGLEDVVELGAGEGEGDGGVAGDGAGVLEEADAVFVEGDVGYGEVGVVGGGAGMRVLGLGGGDGRNGEQQGDGRTAHGSYLGGSEGDRETAEALDTVRRKMAFGVEEVPRQEAGGRRQEAGGRKQEAGSRKRGAGSSEREAESREHRPGVPDGARGGERDRASRRTLVALGSYLAYMAGIYGPFDEEAGCCGVAAPAPGHGNDAAEGMVLWERNPCEVSGELELVEKEA